MCGIAGIVDFSGERADDGTIDRMLDRLAHRGPDDRATASLGACTLGHVRLAILDLSPRGRQPMRGARDETWIVTNGEIYNSPALRVELEGLGHTFTSRSDTEAAVRLYDELGLEAIARLRGMFALAIWDGRRQRLTLARDPLGKKPLYYSTNAGRFAFSSEILPLLELPWVSRELNPRALVDYWKYRYNPGARTFFRSIERLAPGQLMTVEAERVETRRYWTLPDAHPREGLSLDDACGEFVERLDEAIRLRLLSDLPVGAFLSGGLDSSSIVALMSRHASRLKTFTVAFPGGGTNEAAQAREFAERYGTEHTEIPFHETAFTPEILDVVVDHFGEPFGDSSALPSYFITRAMKQHVTVALSGDGGDEVLGGYHTSRWLEKIQAVSRLPQPLLRLGAGSASWLGQRWPLSAVSAVRQAQKGLAAASSSVVEQILSVMVFLNEDELERMLQDPQAFDSAIRARPDALQEVDLSRGPLFAQLQFDLRQKLPDDMLTKMDRMSMANAFEVRCPLLDQELVEWSVSLPPEFRFHKGETKRILRRALGHELGHEVLKRPKTGFSIALSSWKNRAMLDLGRELMDDERIRRQGLFSVDFTRDLLRDFADPDSVPPARLSRFQVETRFWLMLVFQRWHQKHVARAA